MGRGSCCVRDSNRNGCDRFTVQMDQALEPWDVWLCPVAATPAFKGREKIDIGFDSNDLSTLGIEDSVDS